MIPDKVNAAFIPNDLLQSWAQTARADLSALLQTPGITLGHLEERLAAQARKLMLPILRAAAQQKAAQQPFLCPICGGALLAEAHQRPRTLDPSAPGWSSPPDANTKPASNAPASSGRSKEMNRFWLCQRFTAMSVGTCCSRTHDQPPTRT